MYIKHMVHAEAWRDFIAEAPTYTIQVYSGIPFYLNLEDILVQGAVSLGGESPIPDPSTDLDQNGVPKGPPFLYTVDETPLRGWRYSPSVVERAQHLTVEQSRDRKGWIITSEQGWTGEDCFNFVLSNGKQPSYYGKVIVEVLPWYELNVDVQYDPDTNQYRFVGSIDIPPEADVPVFYKYEWHYEGPNDYDGDGIVTRDAYRRFFRTSWYSYYRGYISITNLGRDTGWITVDTDESADGKLDIQQAAPYAATMNPQEIIVTVTMYLEGSSSRPKWNGEQYVIKKRLSELLNIKPWYDSGHIEDITKPTLGESLGEERPPYVNTSGVPTYPVDDPFIPDVDSPA